MKTISIVAIAAAATSGVLGRDCSILDLQSIMSPGSQCESASGVSNLALSTTAPSPATLAELCKIESCKTVIKLINQLPCTCNDESARKKFTCDPAAPSSASNAQLGATAAAIISIVTLFFQFA
ncbi:hypothetical protein LEN26_009728 [Aphanomyces euteiches]|nr:hypothetical protein LEN26_009728 [Aphanomyces euteiches]